MAMEPAELRLHGAALEQGYSEVASQHARADGALVTAFVRGPVVTDLGDTVTSMSRRAGMHRLPLRARRTVEGICRMNDALFERNAVILRLESGGALALRDAVDKLGRICARLSRLRI
ncbi:MAG TPA: hypothetical protein VN874_07085 [Myxococcales bacterium]|jgi:hypothetical protein|nr:hypothetical protein [Myxococcales bacterium]